MSNLINHDLAHRYIILDLVIRTLERDLQHLNDLKTKEVITKLYERAVIQAREELKHTQKEMHREGLRMSNVRREDELITVYTVIQKGLSNELRYISYALRNHTLTEIERLLNI